MLRLLVSPPNLPAVNITRLRRTVQRVFKRYRYLSPAEISISFVSTRKMAVLSRRYLKDSRLHEVISFPLSVKGEKPLFPSPDHLSHLGEIVISYPQAVRQAAREQIGIDQKIDMLVEHACLHLLGHHHP